MGYVTAVHFCLGLIEEQHLSYAMTDTTWNVIMAESDIHARKRDIFFLFSHYRPMVKRKSSERVLLYTTRVNAASERSEEQMIV